MLYCSQDPPGEGRALNLSNAPAGLAPPDFHGMSPEEYRGDLRALYRANPRPFVDLARLAHEGKSTYCSKDRPDLVAVLYDAIVGVAQSQGWDIAGGYVESAPKDLSGRYVPPRGTDS